MNILCIGDVVGSAGCAFVRTHLPALKKQKAVDLVIANGENSADGNGILPASAEHLFTSGVDVITTGNHVFRRREIYETLEKNPRVLRPANYPAGAPGCGFTVVDVGYTRVAVGNLMGVAFLESLACPFETADRLTRLAREEDAPVLLLDVHAEATAEKKALAYYLDGRVSAVFGTHTHTQTADEQILPGGAGFITDLGMTGPYQSVLGVKPELAIRKMKEKLPVRFAAAEGPCFLCGCLFGVDPKSGRCTACERIEIR